MLRDDTVRPPLQPPYTGPFAVTARTDKTFTLLIKGQAVTVTIDRLKPAYILSDDNDTPLPPSHSPPRQPCSAAPPNASTPLPPPPRRPLRKVRFTETYPA